MPPEVLSLREESLSKEAYTGLAADWADYARDHPRSALAQVEWARSLRYSGADPDVVEKHVREAYRIDPKSPEALDAMAHLLVTTASDADEVRRGMKMAHEATEIAPDWPQPRLTIWGGATQLGLHEDADRAIREIFDMGGFETPVLDFGYNLLMSAEPGAILLTNGDNDTYPLIALQKARGIRTDVTVMNLSFLNIVDYGARAFDSMPGGASPLSGEALRDLKADWNVKPDRPFAMTVFAQLVDRVARSEWTKPVYLAVTVADSYLEACDRDLEIEGLLWRVTTRPKSSDGEKKLNAARTRELFQREFRLDSVTDSAYAWSRRSSVKFLVRNYPAVLQLLASASVEAGDRATAAFALDRAIRILDFHGEKDRVRQLARYWKDMDPESHEADRWL